MLVTVSVLISDHRQCADGAAVPTLVRMCGIESRCLVWLVLSLLAARGSHVLPVGAVVLHGFR